MNLPLSAAASPLMESRPKPILLRGPRQSRMCSPDRPRMLPKNSSNPRLGRVVTGSSSEPVAPEQLAHGPVRGGWNLLVSVREPRRMFFRGPR